MAKERYISVEDEYSWVNPKESKDGKPVVVKLRDGEEFTLPLSSAQMLTFCLEGYMPSAESGTVLSPDEIVAYSEAKKALRSGGEHGYVRLDSTQYAVARKIVGWVVPLQAWFEELTNINEMLEAAPSAPPWVKAVKETGTE